MDSAKPERTKGTDLAAKAASDRYTSLAVTAMIDGVLVVDRSWTVAFLNPAGRRLLAAAHSAGQSFWTLFPEAAVGDPAHADCYRGVMNRSKPCDFETFYSDPINRWMHIRANPTQEGMIIFFRDTTQQRRIVSALIDSETKAATERFVSALAREVNHPLEILVKLFWLVRAQCNDPGVQAHLEPAEQELHRISKAIRARLGPSSRSSE